MIDKFKDLYGDKAKSIKIMFPPAAPEIFFAQWYKRYGKSTLVKCKGDGETATTSPEFAEGLEQIGEDERGFIQVKCLGPECKYQESKECSRMAALQVILPEIEGIGVWQINTGSYNSIVNINSAIDWLKGLCGRYAMIPVTLMRQPTDTSYKDGKERKRSKHYILNIDTQDVSIGTIQKFVSVTPVERALIPGPDESKDALFHPENVVDVEEKDVLPAPVEKEQKKEASSSSQSDVHDEGKGKGTGKKGPILSMFDNSKESQKVMNDLIKGIQTIKTKQGVKDYCEKFKKDGYIDKLIEPHKNELREWVKDYMGKLTK